jgi:hypothetical protein
MSPNQHMGQGLALVSCGGTTPALFKEIFCTHFNPVEIHEQVLVRELARRATQLDEFDAALAALRRQGEAALRSVLTSPSTDAADAQQIASAGILASGRYEAVLRQSLATARGFSRALRVLDDCRRRASAPDWGNPLTIDPRFSSETACCAHLVRRYVQGICGCGDCGAVAEGGFIPSGLCWQCARCRAQTGLRVGTCMECSAIPLTKWFAAIRALLLMPSVAITDLATFLQINRRQTVHKMAKRIHTACESDSASAGLAGLDELYLGRLT